MELVEIGYFSKTHGLKGQLLLKPSKDFDFAGMKALFVDQQGNKAPYFVSAVSEMPQGLLVTLEELGRVEEAKSLVNKKVFVNEALLFEDEANNDLAGYELIDRHIGSLGEIRSVIFNGAQELLVLNFKNREVMLPLVEEFVEEINDLKKVVHYRAPEGLLDIYLHEE